MSVPSIFRGVTHRLSDLTGGVFSIVMTQVGGDCSSSSPRIPE